MNNYSVHLLCCIFKDRWYKIILRYLEVLGIDQVEVSFPVFIYTICVEVKIISNNESLYKQF